MLNVRCSGSGEPVVLLHGLFGSLENLGAIARLLARQYTVYSVDLPNHGRSPHVRGGNLATMAKLVRAWVDSEGLHGINLIGHSLGGKVAMEMSLSAPELVRRLVVVDIAPVAYPERHNDVFAGLRAICLQAISSRTQADHILSEYVQEDAVRTFLLKNLSKGEGGFTWRMNLDDLEAQYPDLIAANRLGVFPGPVLFLKGGLSDYITSTYKEEILQRFPSAQLREVENTAHWLHAEKPELVAKLISKFLQS